MLPYPLQITETGVLHEASRDYLSGHLKILISQLIQFMVLLTDSSLSPIVTKTTFRARLAQSSAVH
jgi:hypothetical protein